MLNLLIANKNLQNLQDLSNYIAQYMPDIRVSFWAKNGEEVINTLYQYHYDIILMEQKLPIYNGLEVLEKMPEFKKGHYKKSIIFLVPDQKMIVKLKSNNLIFDTILCTDSISSIISSLKKLVTNKKEYTENSYIKTKIINELQSIGFNLAHYGTHYLAEAILLITTFKYDAINLNKTIYPKLSTIYNKNINNIKTSIIIATNAAYENMDKYILKNYLRVPDTIKPTAKIIINSIVKKLNQELSKKDLQIRNN